MRCFLAALVLLAACGQSTKAPEAPGGSPTAIDQTDLSGYLIVARR